MDDTSKLFDRQRVRAHRDRASERFADFDFLHKEISARLADRLEDMKRRFGMVLDIGAHNGTLAGILRATSSIETCIQSDISESMIRRANGHRVVCDEEWLPFADGVFDAVLSANSLHWVNDLPGTLIQIRRMLKDDGLFLAVLPGANTLKELRAAMLSAASKSTGGFAPSLSPLVEVRDAGALLQRTGFALPVVDSDTITVNYASPFKLFHDLRGMGETNALMQQHKYITRKRWWFDVAEAYQELSGNSDGTVSATFEFITLTGWKPHASQQQPAKRGSGAVHLSTVLGPPVAKGGHP
jgi:NADH dehydrogenase [ubiquinone] 1 alpha subcomplex assembly factor 5